MYADGGLSSCFWSAVKSLCGHALIYRPEMHCQLGTGTRYATFERRAITFLAC